MRISYMMVFVLSTSLGLGSCGWLDDGSPRCESGVTYPRCSADGVLEQCLSGNYLLRDSCTQGKVCLEGSSGSDPHWAACVQQGSQECDFQTFVPTCDGSGSLWICSRLGYTQKVVCQQELDGSVCKQSPVRAACVKPDAQVCDPAEFEPVCSGDRPEYCDREFGFVAYKTACQTPEVCKVGTDGPVCVGSESQPCDYLDYLPTCQADVILACDPITGFTELRPCQEGQMCLQSSSWPGAKCFDDSVSQCDRTSFARRCEDGKLVVCNAFGVEEPTECNGDMVCLSSTGNSACAEPDAQACDWLTYVPSCDGDAPLVCDANSAFTRHLAPCQLPMVCRMKDSGPACVASDSQACAPEDFFCDGADRIICSGGWTERWPCEQGLICVPDENNLFLPLSCVDPGAQSCEVTEPAVCDQQTGIRCAGGYRVNYECKEGEECASNGQWFGCVPDDTPTCDPGSYEDHCQDNTMHVCWEPGFELEFWCSSGLVCVDSDSGPACAPPFDAPDCDPETVIDHCEGDSIAICIDEGKLIFRKCGEGTSCQEMWNGPACVTQ